MPLLSVYASMKTHKKSSFIFRFCCLLLLPLLWLALAGCERTAPPHNALKEERGGTPDPKTAMPADSNMRERRLAVIPGSHEKWDYVTFSDDGKKVFYGALRAGERFFVVASSRGEATSPAYEGISFFVTSPAGGRFAFGGKRGKRKRLVVDNKELDLFDHEEVAPASFSPDGSLVACEVGGFKDEQWFISVTDGEKEVYRSKVYPDSLRKPFFSPDGRFLVFELGDKQNISTKGKRRVLFVLDVAAGKVVKEMRHADSQTGELSFSSDASRIVYDITKDGTRHLVLIDFTQKKERKIAVPYSSIRQLALSPDGEWILFTAVRDGNTFLVESPWDSPEERKEGASFDAIRPVVFLPGSTQEARFVYQALQHGRWRIIAGGREGARYDGIGDSPPTIGPEGARMAFAANKGGRYERRGLMGGQWVMVIASVDRPAKVKEGPAYDMAVTPVFSPDGRRIAYRVRRGPMENAKRFIVIADAESGEVIAEGPAGDAIWPPVWSADSTSVGYGARLGRELWWKVETVQ